MNACLKLCFTLVISLFLVACALTTSTKNALPSFTETQGSPEQLIAQANNQKDGTVATQYHLIAADKLLQQKRMDQASKLLVQVESSPLTPSQKIMVNLLKAELAFSKKDNATALKLLTAIDTDELDQQDTALQIRVYLLKATILTKQGKLLQALRERCFITSFLKGQALADNQNSIWKLAMSLPLDSLNHINDSGETGGWISLAKAVKTSTSLDEQKTNIAQWMQDNPTHLAAINPPADLVKIQNFTTENITKIALLLPQKEKYADAIYNGFLAAYYQTNDTNKPTIKLYESTQYSSMDAFYEQAEKDGVQLVIGPIEKNLVKEISHKPQLPILTLALNYSDDSAFPPQLFQFGLLPEDEAREAAIKAWADGRRHMVAIVPRGEWGKKVLAAFRQQWEQQGGVLEAVQYIDRPVDLDKQIVELINKLPSTDNNANGLFMVANPMIARQIRALMTYHDLQSTPVYATSHIYAGVADATQDNDLNGVLFCETPWLLYGNDSIEQQIISQWPQANSSFGRLYAMGVDTWRLAPRLLELRALPNSSINGLSGELSINSLQRVERKLPWAVFVNGLIQPAEQLPPSNNSPEIQSVQ